MYLYIYTCTLYIYICFFQSVGLHIQPNPFIYLSFQLKLCAGVPPCPARCHGRRNAQSHDEPWVSSHGVEESKYSMSTHWIKSHWVILILHFFVFIPHESLLDMKKEQISKPKMGWSDFMTSPAWVDDPWLFETLQERARREKIEKLKTQMWMREQISYMEQWLRNSLRSINHCSIYCGYTKSCMVCSIEMSFLSVDCLQFSPLHR